MSLATQLSISLRLWVCSVFLLVLPALIYSAHLLNTSHQKNRVQRTSSLITEEIGERFGLTHTILSSMVGLHTVFPKTDRNEMIRFARELVGESDFIKDIGKYEQITADQRNAFEAAMQTKGYVGFGIQQMNETGNASRRALSDIYYPLSIVDHFSNGSLSMLGIDLGEDQHLYESLQQLSINDNGLISMIPDRWNLQGEIITFKPYTTRQASSPLEDRESVSSKGGFWLTVDLSKLLNDIGELTSEFDLSVTIVDAQGSTPVITRSANERKPLYFNKLYSPLSIEHRWNASPDVASTRKEL